MSGVTGAYPGGTIWGIRVQDTKPEAGYPPSIIRYRNETEARQAVKSWRRIDCHAELLVARIHWQVQPDS